MNASRILCALASAIALTVVMPSTASALPGPSDVQFDLRGCNLGANEDLVAQSFVCTAYANGNFGKDWAELDLVPHRLEVNGKGKKDSTNVLDYTFAVAGDEQDGGDPGWDYISAPVVNAALSGASCTIDSVSGVLSKQPGEEGADKTIYRLVEISHEDDESCVLDWYQRLALGSAEQSGSSLHSYLLDEDAESAGNQTLPIPVEHAQGLSKTMEAQRDKTYPWNITKTAPATVDFPEPCDPEGRDAQINVKIEWDRLDAVDSDTVRVVTNISATNPSQRPVSVSVTDVIRSGATPLTGGTLTAPAATVPANTTTTVATHTFDVPAADAVNLNDVATATYSDPVTSAPVAGNTTATASAAVTPGGFANELATIKDDETITGNGLSFRVDSVTAGSAGGAFGSGPGGLGGVLTLPTADFSATDPAGAGGTIYWESDPQAGDGFVEFNKTISVAGDISTTGTLSDTATLAADDGFAAVPATASTAIESKACGKVVVDKETLPDGASDTFEFSAPDLAAYNGGSSSLTATDAQDAEVVVPAGSYDVTELGKAGWNLSGLTCDDTASPTASAPDSGNNAATFNVDPGETVTCEFENTRDATIIVEQKTDPEGAGETFEFSSLELPDEQFTLPVSEGNSFAAGHGDTKQAKVAPGTYTVTQGVETAWLLVSLTCDDGSSSQPSVPVLGDRKATFKAEPGETVTCTWTNRRTLPPPGSPDEQLGDPQQPQGEQAVPAGNTPVQVVRGERVTPGTARLAGATGCRARPFTVRVKGRSIQRVEFFIDGKKRKTVSRPDSAGRYKLKVDPRRFKVGSHRLVARAVFQPDSGTRAKSMALRFSRCVRAAQAPAFTG